MELSKSIKIVKALGDNSRLLILNTLKEKSCYVEELAERLNLAESTVSFHLKKLEEAGLVCKAKEQYYVVYRVNREILGLTLDSLLPSDRNLKAVQDDRIIKYRDDVIRTFRRKGRIEKLPAQYKKRILLYEDILKHFEPGIIYDEKEVDRIISEIYDDYCTVRRAFVDEKMMYRKRGEYKVNTDYKYQFPAEVPVNKKKSNSKMNKNEIKKLYKAEGAPMGVYMITNLETGGKYIGSAKNLNGMINRHKFELSMGMHQIKELQEVWKRSGEEKIKFEMIDKLERKDDPDYNYTEDLEILENLWYEKYSGDNAGILRLKNTRLAKDDKKK